MKKRRRLIFVVIGVVLAVVLAFVFWPREREPRYQGRKLSDWVSDYSDPRLGGPGVAEYDRTEAAISAIGTNAIPFLLRWLQEEPAPARSKIRNMLPLWAQDTRFAFILLNGGHSQVALAAPYAFRALGTNGVAAIPGLLEISRTNSGTPGMAAIVALADMGQPGLGAILSIATNGAALHRMLAMYWLAHNQSLYSDATPAIPPLLCCLSDTNEPVVQAAAEALGTLKLQPDIVVPRLAATLTNTRTNVRMAAIIALSEYGSNAAPALNSLSNCLKDFNPGIAAAAARAIEKIRPASATAK